MSIRIERVKVVQLHIELHYTIRVKILCQPHSKLMQIIMITIEFMQYRKERKMKKKNFKDKKTQFLSQKKKL
jgi:hypothetical protein